MEELQDAIEDAQYMNAMHDDVPRPTKDWKYPTTEELNAYLERQRTQSPKSLELEGICEGSLGFYMFLTFVKSEGGAKYANFLWDVATYRRRLVPSISHAAKRIVADYLSPNSSGNKDPTDKRAASLCRNFKDKVDEVSITWRQFIDDTEGGTQYLGLKGDVLESTTLLVMAAEESSRRIASNAIKPANSVNSATIFDVVDEVVFQFIKHKYFTAFKESPHWIKYHQYMLISERPVMEEDFLLFRVLGRGGFGLVNGCKRAQSGKLFAMKMMNKRRVKLKKADSLCINERTILAVVDSPFVVCLKYAFVNKEELFLILDLMMGGDLGYHLSRKGKFSERESKYYSARIVLGIKALHDDNIVYRDLKPENILMDDAGKTRLSDLGLACKVSKSGMTGTCGTRGYWAPEMLRRDEAGKRERYSVSVDWFSLGCCLYEFHYGVGPFRTEKARNWGMELPKGAKVEKADKDRAIDTAIKEMEPEIDETMDPHYKDIILKLLDKDGTKRLGANGAGEIMAHPWFADINWDQLDIIAPPMIPAKDINMATQSEIGGFSDEKASKKLELTEADQQLYDKWNFVSPRAFQEELVEFKMIEEKLGPIKRVGGGTCCSIV